MNLPTLQTAPPAGQQAKLRRPRFLSAAAVACAFIAALILSPAAAFGEAPPAEAVKVFHCQFGKEWDVNYDAWPDRWVRTADPDHPHYVRIAIQKDRSAPGNKCLQIALDGAAAAVSSPPIRVMPRFSYRFEAQLKNEKLQQSTVALKLDFCNAAGQVLQTVKSTPTKSTEGWQRIQIHHVEPIDPSIDRVVIGLEVERGAKGDLHGRVSLADVRLARLPRIAVSTNNPSNVYTSLNDVLVMCELSGIPERDPEIRYQLLDTLNRVLQSETQRLDGKLIVDNPGHAGDVREGSNRGPHGFEGTTEWRPNIPDYGYYRVVVQMLSSQGATRPEREREMASRTIYLAVVPPLPMPRHGEFGWTLPGESSPLTYQDLNRLLPHVGINWAKTPIWFEKKDSAKADELIRFVEVLGASNIEVVGVIDQPPVPGSGGPANRPAPIAEVLSGDPAVWATILEPMMARMALRVRWWQLGRDGDVSFVGFPNLANRIDDVRTALFRFGQDVRIGLSWDWAADSSNGGRVAWDFQQMVSETPPTESQFEALLASRNESQALRWVAIEPPPRQTGLSQVNETAWQRITNLMPTFCPAVNMNELLATATTYSAQLERASELARRMVIAKMHGADAIIISDPFDDDHGLMRSSGMPADLLLPWRTTAALLAGSQYIGEMRLPSGSPNRIFRRDDGKVVMVVWNDTPVEETLFLGNDVKQYDLYGRGAALPTVNGEQTVRVSQAPSFILGLHEQITRWRMAVKFEKQQVPSIFAKPHANALHFRNFFPQGVGGSFKIVVLQSRRGEASEAKESPPREVAGFVLDRWTIEPPHSNFQLAADSAITFPIEIELRNALFGKQPVRIDFKLEADHAYQFSVYGELEVGTQDLTLDVNTFLDKDGALIVEQLMTNNSDQLADFRCFLRTKGHRRQRMQVYRLGKELDRKVYRFGDGENLLGQEMLLELEELNGPRELRYRFTVRDMPVDDKSPTRLRGVAPHKTHSETDKPSPHDVVDAIKVGS